MHTGKIEQNGTIQTSQQEEKIGKTQKADQMGAFLDSAENVRQDKKTASWQAHKIKKKLEKNED